MDNLEKLQELAQNLPDTVKGNALALITEMGTVIEGIGDDPIPWKPNYLRLVQGTTDRGSIPKGTAIGEFVLGETKVDQPLHFIPIRFWSARQYWSPDQNVNKQLCWSPDAKLGLLGECKSCPHAKWRDEGGGSDCSKIVTALAIDSKFRWVFTITFAKSNYKIGLELEAAMKKAGVASYARTYGLSSQTNPTAKNVENFKLEILDDKLRRTPEEYIPFLKELFDRVSSDRNAMIKAFYDGAELRRERLALSGETPLALESSTEAGSSEVKVETATEKVSPMAKGYTV